MIGEQKRTRVLISSRSSGVNKLLGMLLWGASERCRLDGGMNRPCSYSKLESRFVMDDPASGVVEM